MFIIEDGFFKEVDDSFIAPTDPEIQPVFSVTRSQAKNALLRIPYSDPDIPEIDNMLDAVAAIVSTMPRDIQIWYTDALHWERSNPYVAGFSVYLGLTDDQADDLFMAASKLA